MPKPLTPTLYAGMLRPYPGISADWPDAKRALAADILATLREIFPDRDFIPVPGADIEDFWEDAFLLVAAHRASDRLEIVTGKTAWTDEELTRRMGPVSWDETGGRHSRDAFIMHPLVDKYGGRAMALTTYNSGEDYAEHSDTIIDWIVDRHRAGIAHVVVKNAENKSGIWVLPTSADPGQVKSDLLETLDWTLVRLDGLKDALLVQDMLDLQYEMRCFVVDGVVVTAAGGIEEHTPLEMSSGGSFAPGTGVWLDDRLRQYRGHLTEGGPSPLVAHEPEIAQRLLAFAREVAAEHGGTVVIDVALDAAANTPVIVELNELSNSGLFATNPFLVAEKLTTARDRGYENLRTAAANGFLPPGHVEAFKTKLRLGAFPGPEEVQ
ncbi:hypothetical protein ACXR2T_08150 [Leucobacter sp. HY1910]